MMILSSGSRGGGGWGGGGWSGGGGGGFSRRRRLVRRRRRVGELVMLTPEDHERITAAVAKAEEGTSGDIFCVLAGEVSTYREVPIAWGAAAALLVPPIVLAFGLRPLLDAITAGGWTAAQASALPGELGFALTGYAIAQLLLFALVTHHRLAGAGPPAGDAAVPEAPPGEEGRLPPLRRRPQPRARTATPAC